MTRTGHERPLLVHFATSDVTLERMLGDQLEAYAAAGYSVIGMSAAGPYVERLEQRGIRHVALKHLTRAMAPREDALVLGEMYSRFRELRPTIIHMHNPKPAYYGCAVAKAARVPLIVNTVHGLFATEDDSWKKRAFVYSFERVAAAFSDAELLQNEEDMPVLRRLRVPADRLAVLGNGIDLGQFDPKRLTNEERAAARRELGATGETDVVVGLVGRLVREKGYRDVFDAVQRLHVDHPELRFAVIGPSDPDKGDALSQRELDDAAAAGVKFLGERDDVARLYGGMDLYVLASYREGFPRSAMEAAAMQVPVIATNIRGCRQVVEPGVNGLLVPPHRGDAIAAAILEIASDPVRRRHMGEAGRAKAEREFDQQRCIAITLDTYERLLTRAGIAH